jgi:hypothetical protein
MLFHLKSRPKSLLFEVDIVIFADREWAELLCWLETKQFAETNKNRLELFVVGKLESLSMAYM